LIGHILERVRGLRGFLFELSISKNGFSYRGFQKNSLYPQSHLSPFLVDQHFHVHFNIVMMGEPNEPA
jgi:hypothetical protein